MSSFLRCFHLKLSLRAGISVVTDLSSHGVTTVRRLSSHIPDEPRDVVLKM